jgi:hypothetical protein
LAEGATWATWIKGAMIDAPILKSRQLESLAAHEAYILTDDAQRRVRSVTLTTNVEARCSIQPREALTPPVLNWVASPLERPVQAPAQLKSLPATQAKSFVSKSAQIRKALRTKPSRAIDALPAPETKLL